MKLQAIQTPQQQLTLTPSLQLSLEVLKMPLMQLQAYLHQQLEENPLLEPLEQTAESDDRNDLRDGEESLRQLDESFVELWRQADGSPADRPTEQTPPRELPGQPPTLQEHLALQVRCLDAEESVRQAAEIVLGWLDADGYLREPLEEIATTEGLTVSVLEQALALLHRLDPPGVGARSLPECLLIQLVQAGQADGLAARIVREHFDLFVGHRLRSLAHRLSVSLSDIRTACRTIVQLAPKPARNFTQETAAPLIPDLIVRHLEGTYEVELNDEGLPSVTIAQRYRRLLRDPNSPSETRQFIRDRLNQATWLQKAIAQRRATLLAIGRVVVELEQGFLAHGVSALCALTQEEIATRIGCHPSTVSRAIAGKTIQTPHGILPLEAFCGGGISQESQAGRRLSSRTVHAELKHLIASEDPQCPLSDQTVVQRLHAAGFPVARRTVAKYRTSLNILPVHLRKRRL